MPASALRTAAYQGSTGHGVRTPGGSGSLPGPGTPGDLSSLRAQRGFLFTAHGAMSRARKERYLPGRPLSPRPAGVTVPGLSFYRFPTVTPAGRRSPGFPTVVQREAGSGRTGGSAQAGPSPAGRQPRPTRRPKGLRCALGGHEERRFLTGGEEKVRSPALVKENTARATGRGNRENCSRAPPLTMGASQDCPQRQHPCPIPGGPGGLSTRDFHFLTLAKSLLRRGPTSRLPSRANGGS